MASSEFNENPSLHELPSFHMIRCTQQLSPGSPKQTRPIWSAGIHFYNRPCLLQRNSNLSPLPLSTVDIIPTVWCCRCLANKLGHLTHINSGNTLFELSSQNNFQRPSDSIPEILLGKSPLSSCLIGTTLRQTLFPTPAFSNKAVRRITRSS